MNPCLPLIDSPENRGGFRSPLQVLAAVQAQELPGERFGIQDEFNGCRDVFKIGASLQKGAFALPGKVLFRLIRARQGRARTYRIHSDIRRERDRGYLSERPQTSLGYRI